jgi:hypothetical protein
MPHCKNQPNYFEFVTRELKVRDLDSLSVLYKKIYTTNSNWKVKWREWLDKKNESKVYKLGLWLEGKNGDSILVGAVAIMLDYRNGHPQLPQGTIHRQNSPAYNILTIVVDENYRRQGHARRLLLSVFKNLRNKIKTSEFFASLPVTFAVHEDSFLQKLAQKYNFLQYKVKSDPTRYVAQIGKLVPLVEFSSKSTAANLTEVKKVRKVSFNIEPQQRVFNPPAKSFIPCYSAGLVAMASLALLTAASIVASNTEVTKSMADRLGL